MNQILLMRMHLVILVLLSMPLPIWAVDGLAEKTVSRQNGKKYDLVLVHGLGNRHKWSDAFLETCLEIWGSGRVFVVYTNQDRSVISREYSGGTIFFSGGKGRDAGINSIDTQVKYLSEGVNILTDSYGLQVPFSIIAHSMGGLVTRRYVYENPDTVAGLVTLGTPHHGTPLADSFKWTGYFIGTADAMEDLTTAAVSKFNTQYPADNMPMTHNKKMYTIRGNADWFDGFGWVDELQLGWLILSKVYETDNDGLVPHESAVIDGADNIADFPDFDHNDLVRRSEVAKAAAAYLP